MAQWNFHNTFDLTAMSIKIAVRQKEIKFIHLQRKKKQTTHRAQNVDQYRPTLSRGGGQIYAGRSQAGRQLLWSEEITECHLGFAEESGLRPRLIICWTVIPVSDLMRCGLWLPELWRCGPGPDLELGLRRFGLTLIKRRLPKRPIRIGIRYRLQIESVRLQLLDRTVFPQDFYARQQELLYRVLAIAILSVCPSVCLSHGWIRQKRSKLGSSTLHHLLPQRL